MGLGLTAHHWEEWKSLIKVSSQDHFAQSCSYGNGAMIESNIWYTVYLTFLDNERENTVFAIFICHNCRATYCPSQVSSQQEQAGPTIVARRKNTGEDEGWERRSVGAECHYSAPGLNGLAKMCWWSRGGLWVGS